MGFRLKFRFVRACLPAAKRAHAITEIRKVQLSDHAALADFYAGLGRQTLRCRFHGAVNGLTEARISQIVALGQGNPRQAQTFVACHREGGLQCVVAHAGWHACSTHQAELALVVADAWQGKGIGHRLLRELIDSACVQGIQDLRASVMSDNTAMQALLDSAGFQLRADPEDSALLVGRIKPQRQRPPTSLRACLGWLPAFAQRSPMPIGLNRSSA
jgi:RimJ/RimL family protein N-acetyltransferase